jgi:hypothetical protein
LNLASCKIINLPPKYILSFIVGKKDSESETEEDSAPKKKRLRSNLLDTKLSDSDSDFVTAKKSQKR